MLRLLCFNGSVSLLLLPLSESYFNLSVTGSQRRPAAFCSFCLLGWRIKFKKNFDEPLKTEEADDLTSEYEVGVSAFLRISPDMELFSF